MFPSESQTAGVLVAVGDEVWVTAGVIVNVGVSDIAKGESISIYNMGIKYPANPFFDFESSLFLVKFKFF